MSVPYILSENSLTIFVEGKPHTLRKDHANFNLARKAILDGETEKLSDLVDVQRCSRRFRSR